MFAMLKRFFQFLFPIMKDATVQVALEKLEKQMHEDRPRRRYRGLDDYVAYSDLKMPSPRKVFTDCDECKRSLGTPHRDYCSKSSSRLSSEEALQNLRDKLTGVSAHEATERFHDVLMVAFDVSGEDKVAVHEWLMRNLPRCGYHEIEIEEETFEVDLDSWWVANDERFDGSDCDSAVFVTKGLQPEARSTLRMNNLVD